MNWTDEDLGAVVNQLQQLVHEHPELRARAEKCSTRNAGQTIIDFYCMGDDEAALKDDVDFWSSLSDEVLGQLQTVVSGAVSYIQQADAAERAQRDWRVPMAFDEM